MNTTISVKAAAALAASLVTLAGCSGVRQAVGAEKVAPDEFRVVTKAPLELPPEYNLRPPQPGQPRPQDLLPSDLSDTALYGYGDTSNASDAERLLLAKAGVARATPAIRAVVDAEGGGLIRKSRGFANRVIFWRGDDVADETSPAVDVDATEAARRDTLVESATGGDEVVVKRNVRTKLPGL